MRLLAPALLLALASCSAPPPPDTSRTMVVWEQEDAQVVGFMDSMFEGFKKQPGMGDVVIKRTHYHTEDLRQQFQTASIAGNPPDLLMAPSDFAGVFSISGFILPVEGLFTLERFNKPVVDAITLDGKTWGVPISNGNHLMLFYNKRLAPKPPASTQELLGWCRAETRRKGLSWCMALNIGEPFWFVPWLGAFGGWPMEGHEPTLDTPAMRGSLSFLLDLIDEKAVPAECDYNCVDSLFKEEKVAFIVNGDWSIPAYYKKLGKDLGVALIPKVSSTGRLPTPMVSGQYFMLSSKLSGEKLALARRLVDFYVSKDNQLAQLKTLSRLPALSEAARSRAVQDSPVLKGSMAQILAGRPMPMATEMRAVWDAMRPYLAQVLARRLGVEEAARKMQSDALTKIREMND